MVRHWVFNHPQKLLRTISSPDTQLVQQLNCGTKSKEMRINNDNTNEKHKRIKCLPIRPQKRVKVLGMRVCGLISIKAFFSV